MEAEYAKEQAKKIVELMKLSTTSRLALYRILQLTKTPMRLEELEQVSESLPEMRDATQEPSQLIEWLVNWEALEWYDVDAQGNRVDREVLLQTMSEEEVDTIIDGIMLQITEAGLEALTEYNLESKLVIFLEALEEKEVYLEALRFVTNKQMFASIDRHLRSTQSWLEAKQRGSRLVEPSTILGKLSGADAVYYADGWQASPEGIAVLKLYE